MIERIQKITDCEKLEKHTYKVDPSKRELMKLVKKDAIILKIAKTFVALCEYADFTSTRKKVKKAEAVAPILSHDTIPKKILKEPLVSLDSLQYHINIVLPESRDQAVYDAIFKSLRDHLG